MSKTAFVDESKRKGYMLCAVVVDQAEFATVRKALTRVKGRPSRIHMSGLHLDECFAYARTLGELDVTSVVAAARGRADRAARDLLLRQLIPHLLEMGVRDLVIESCQQDQEDRRTLRELLGPSPAMQYRHDGKADPLLAMPDIGGWAHGRGGRYRAAVKSITTDLGIFDV
jgi:hypothetical protein